MHTPRLEQSINERITQVFRTPVNIFSLSRLYRSKRLPSHDPEEHLNIESLSEIPSTTDVPAGSQDGGAKQLFGPYPNRSSLGDWYWSGGAAKSHENFQKLLKVITDPEFRASDVKDMKWSRVNQRLGINDFDEARNSDGEENEEWLDDDAGWKKTPIYISVPFHRQSRNPGPQECHIGDLHHRSLTSVIREKLSNAEDAPHFHYEPFELLWKPTPESPEVRVHGEAYSSPTFLETHRKLQESPPEPGCNLPRVVVAMMFWSDGTHLTNFGAAKLWPCYLFFGNESKYRRCKPSCKLCNHVAYFQAVRIQIKCVDHNYLNACSAP
jgi:hypothetical protein